MICSPPFALRSMFCALIVAGCAPAPGHSVDVPAPRDGVDVLAPGDAAVDTPVEPPPGVIALLVTVDWEGREMTEANLRAMEAFRTRFPAVRLVHFLNAAYYTKPGAVPATVTQAMRRVIRSDDELGLHIHGWRSLIEASGVTFRNEPTFWGTAITSADCAVDCGHDVAISAYTTAELGRVIAFSVRTLEAQGLGRATSFRAGGWLAGDTVRAALAQEGFTYDHSAVPSMFLAGELSGRPLLNFVRALWKGTTMDAQPYRLPAGTATLTEVPDNGALADYVTATEMLAVFDGAARALADSPAVDRVVSIGFHQETAMRYLPRIQAALDGIALRVADQGVAVRYVTSRDLPRPD